MWGMLCMPDASDPGDDGGLTHSVTYAPYPSLCLLIILHFR